jgi:CelD/BcsL family acetyltransferase involved in cellulose biosynthesis
MTETTSDLGGGLADSLPSTREWDELADRVQAPPFLHSGWIAAWLRAFGGGELRTIEARREGELVALLPMLRQRSRLCSPANWHTPMFGPLSVDAAARDEVVARVFDQSSALVDLSFLDGDGNELESIVRAAREAGRPTVARPVAQSLFIDVDTEIGEYEQCLSRNRRKALRRHRRNLEAEGEVGFEVHDGSTGLDELIAEVFAVEASGWKGKAGTAMSSTPATASFYTDVARWAADRGWLRLALLRLDGRPIACDFALEQGGAWYTLKAGYDEEFRSFGPGALLLFDEVAHCCESPDVSRIELLGHEDDFKASWTTEGSPRTSVSAFTRSPAGLVRWMAATSLERARPSLRRVRDRWRGERGLALAPGALIALDEWVGFVGLAQLPL